MTERDTLNALVRAISPTITREMRAELKDAAVRALVALRSEEKGGRR